MTPAIRHYYRQLAGSADGVDQGVAPVAWARHAENASTRRFVAWIGAFFGYGASESAARASLQGNIRSRVRRRDDSRERPVSLGTRPTPRAVALVGLPTRDDDDGEPLPQRPRTRGECADGPRPCPWLSCRYHLASDETASGSVTLVHPDRDLGDLEATCALDVAAEGPHNLYEIGRLTNVTHERIRQIEKSAMRKVRSRLPLLDSGLKQRKPIAAE